MIGFDGRRSLRRLGPVIDRINIALSICVIISGIFLVLDMKKYDIAFPVLFTFSAVINLLLAVKCYKMAEMGRMVALGVAFVLLTVLAVIGYIVTLS